jgi:hypothetical protein
VAIRHFPEQTLSQHYFGRTGDAWKAAIPHLRGQTTANRVLDILGLTLVFQEAHQRLDTPCPECSAEELSASGARPCILRRGFNDFTSPDAGEPDRFVCQACDVGIFPDQLLESKSAKEKDALVQDGPLRAFVPPPTIFIVAELDGKHSVALTAAEALRPLLGAVFHMTQRLCRLECSDLAHALALVEKHHSEMPFRETAIGRDLQTVGIRWHRGALQDWEKRKVEDRAAVQRLRELQTLDDEHATIRRARVAALRRP